MNDNERIASLERQIALAWFCFVLVTINLAIFAIVGIMLWVK